MNNGIIKSKVNKNSLIFFHITLIVGIISHADVI